LDPSGRVAVILIGASDYPYGVIEFSETIRPIRVQEKDKSFEIRILRHFGKLGERSIRPTDYIRLCERKFNA